MIDISKYDKMLYMLRSKIREMYLGEQLVVNNKIFENKPQPFGVNNRVHKLDTPGGNHEDVDFEANH